MADLGPLPFVGVVDVNGLHAVDDLADPAGEAAGGELALLSELQELPAQPRDDGELDAHHAGRHQAEPEVLDHDEDEGGRGLRAEKGRQDERVADEAADRLDLVLDDGRGLGGLDVAKRIRRSMRSPSAPLATLIQYLKTPLMRTKNRNSPDKPYSSVRRSTWKPPKMLTWAPPSQSGKPRESWRNGAVSLPWAKDLPWIASLTIRRGRSSEAK